MPRPDQLIKAFSRFGYKYDRVAGSHYILVKDGCLPLSIPAHNKKAIAIGTLKQVIKKAGITIQQFNEVI